MYVTLAKAKKHLNIDDTFTDDDDYIKDLIEVAEGAVSREIDRPLNEVAFGKLPPQLEQAVLLMVSNLYDNRQIVAFTQVVEVPYSYKYLCSQYKAY